MKPFAYAAPGSLRDATSLLSDTWGKTEILAGGTDLLTCLKQNLTSPDRVVSLKNIRELKGVSERDGSLRIGATTTLGDLTESTSVRRHFPALVTAAEGVGSSQLLAMGTVGGDLCQRPRCWYFRNNLGSLGIEGNAALVRDGDNRYHAIFGTDSPALFVSPSSLGPVLVALGASIAIEGPGGHTRTVPAAEFFRIPANDHERETALKPNEILTAIELPLRGLKNAIYEVRHRHGLDWPYVSAAVAFRPAGGSAQEAQVVLGHVAAVPWIARSASAALNGAQLDEQAAARCGEAAVSGAKPLSQNAYKIQLVKTAVKRAVLAAAKA